MAMGVGAFMVAVELQAKPTQAHWLVRLDLQTQRGGGICSGAHIGGGLILTAAHCLTDVRGVSVVTDRGQSVPARVMWATREYDVALIRADISAESAEITCRELVPGDRVSAHGFPQGIDRVTTRGYVASAQRIDVPRMWRDVMALDMTVAPGNSGGPLMYRGRINGIIVGMITGTGFGLAVPSRVICDMLAR